MGRPKALLPFGGEPLIAHIVVTLQPLFGEIVVVAAPGQDLPSMPVTLVRDDVAYQGPVGGIYYGLGAARGDVSFLTSCDSAFLNGRLISYLLSQIPQHDVVVPYWHGRLQPLHAVYRRSVLPHLEEQLARGELRPVSLFDKVRTRRIDEDEIRRFDPEGSSFFNMNTPEDYAEALKRWSSGSRIADGGSRIADGGSRIADGGSGIHCTVELFGVARLLSGAREVPLALPPDATFSHVFAALVEKLPVLADRVISADGRRLIEGYACNVNGVEFVRKATTIVKPGDRIVILSADAGG